ncbi:MAG TPA: LytTR family DNA-binding domain-containing protein [Sphingobacteriaceae bacterium]
MIRCIALDDELYAAEILATYIRKVPFLELVGVTNSAFEALEWVQNGQVDLAFLDIQMPDLNGIQFARIVNNKCKVILTTAYMEYALDGYENDAVDYLLKPISFDRFLRAVQKVQQALPPVVSVQPNFPEEKDYFFIKGDSKNKFVKVGYNEILYVEGLKNYVSVHLSGQRHVTYLTLKDIELQLPGTKFIRVHKSFIVALEKIRMVDGNTIFIGQDKIPIGESYRDHFYSRIRESRL